MLFVSSATKGIENTIKQLASANIVLYIFSPAREYFLFIH